MATKERIAANSDMPDTCSFDEMTTTSSHDVSENPSPPFPLDTSKNKQSSYDDDDDDNNLMEDDEVFSNENNVEVSILEHYQLINTRRRLLHQVLQHCGLTCRIFSLVITAWFILYSIICRWDGLMDDDDSPRLVCACESCSNSWSCVERVEWLLQDDVNMRESEACQRVAEAYPLSCGACADGSCTSDTNTRVDPEADQEGKEEPPLYCFPMEDQRTSYRLWGGKTVQVKQSAGTSVCGPRQNHFSSTGVSVNMEEELLVLRYQDNSASEVRVLLSEHQLPYHYGKYSFSIKSVTVWNANGQLISEALPPYMILSFSTYDPDEVDRYGEFSHHQVKVNIGHLTTSKDDNNQANVQFSVEPETPANVYRFTEPQVAGSIYSFTWSPGSITWESTASSRTGQPETFSVTTVVALVNNRPDAIQCLPDYHMDVRISLFSSIGMDAQFDDTTVEVVVDGFDFVPSGEVALANGEACSKSCQCASSAECVLNTCQEI